MNLNKIPKELHHLIPFAEKWGISDDSERNLLIEKAKIPELKLLLESFNDDDDAYLDNWLCGEEINSLPYSEEYVSFTCLLMAYQYARIVVRDFVINS